MSFGSCYNRASRIPTPLSLSENAILLCNAATEVEYLMYGARPEAEKPTYGRVRLNKHSRSRVAPPGEWSTRLIVLFFFAIVVSGVPRTRSVCTAIAGNHRTAGLVFAAGILVRLQGTQDAILLDLGRGVPLSPHHPYCLQPRVFNSSRPGTVALGASFLVGQPHRPGAALYRSSPGSTFCLVRVIPGARSPAPGSPWAPLIHHRGGVARSRPKSAPHPECGLYQSATAPADGIFSCADLYSPPPGTKTLPSTVPYIAAWMNLGAQLRRNPNLSG